MTSPFSEQGLKAKFGSAPEADALTTSFQLEGNERRSALQARKAIQIQAKIAAVQSQIDETKVKIDELSSRLKSPITASETVIEHIRLLHDYNQIRDIGTGLLGMIANNRGVRIKDVYEEFGVSEGD